MSPGSAAMGVPTLQRVPVDAVRTHLFMVGNAHIDPMWIWDWDEGMHEVLQTFRAAADRLDEDPELRFTASSAAYYAWVHDTAPDLFERIRTHVRSGRWIITGGQWIEPDCNLPAGESVCRQFLYGQRFLDRHFGGTATVGYNIDSFGHSGTLPQLCAAAGITGYVFMRPGPQEKDLPGRVFRWRGADGTELPAYRIPYDYATTDAETEQLRARVAELTAESRKSGVPLMAFFGVGDHGGGPTRLAIRTVHALATEYDNEVGFGDPVAYFDSLETAELPVVTGELQWHAVGCYSARADLKQANARAEDALATAETMNQLCRLLTGDARDERDELAAAWQGVLFAQFHDALGGTCTDRATEAVRDLLVSARVRGETIAVRAAHRVAERVDTWVQGAEAAENMESAVGGIPLPMLVFNPHSWPVTSTVTLTHPLAVATHSGGQRTRIQQIASGEATYSRTRSLLRVSAPPFGYRRYWLHVADLGAEREPGPDPVTVEEHTDHVVLANGLLRIRVDRATGRLTSAATTGGGGGLEGGTELLAGGVRPVALDDATDTWSHGLDRYGGDEEEGRLLSLQVAEPGPVRATVRSVWSLGPGATTVRQEVSLYEGEPFVEIRLDVDWHERQRVLKLVIPTALTRPVSTAGAPYGSVTRPCSGHEEPMVHWVDLSESDGAWGLACTSDCAGGYDASGPTLRLTVLRSPRVADHGQPWGRDDPVGFPCTDQGRSTTRYRVTPHPGPAEAAQIPRLAAAQRIELPVVLDTWHRGDLGPEGSALTVEGEGVVAPVLKQAEDGAGTVVRLWEVAGKAERARIVRGDRTWQGLLAPHELRTLYLPDDDPARAQPIALTELDARRAPDGPELGGLFERHPELADVAGEVRAALALLCRTAEEGGTVYIGGNGGSAADAEHIVGELMKGMEHRRPLQGAARAALERLAHGPVTAEAGYLADNLEGAVRAVCLTSQSGLLSAIANDTAGDMGMAQQLHGYGRPGDLFWALSTSGTSRNVVLGALAARAAGVRVLAFTGEGGGRLAGLADVWVGVPATEVAAVQELHQPIYHALCAAIEERYWPRPG